MAKIEKLTADQAQELIEFRRSMWQLGTSCAPADRKIAEAAIIEAYACIGRPPPRFFWMPSPMTCALALYVLGKFADDTQKAPAGLRAGLRDGLWAGLGAGLRDGLRDGLWDGLRDGLRDAKIDPSIGSTYWWGQMDAYWTSFYRFGSMIGCPQKDDLLRRLDIMERIAASCGFWYPRDGICVVSDRFASVAWDEARNSSGMPTRLHREDGPAVSFRDGWGVCYWHGYRIPPSHEWIVRDRSRITPDTIDAEPNAELRRIMVEAMPGGFGAYIAARGAKLVSEDISHGRPRKLYQAKVGGEVIDILHVINGSLEPDGTRREFHLGAARDRGTRARPKTPHEAVANSYGIAPKVYGEACRT